MGWLWASPSPPKSPAPGQASQAPASTPPSAATKAADSDIDPEIQKFIALFQSDGKQEEPEPQPAQQSTSTSSKSSSSSSWFSLKSSPNSPSQTNDRKIAPPADPNSVSESLLPTEMSCRQAFDMAFHCQSVGGQWNHIYRYGTMRSCSEHWEDFWFCMRIKSYSGKMKEEAIKSHYRQKEHDKYGDGKPNSEDVWQARTTKIPPGTAFTEKFIEEATLSDEEWQRMEMERRRQIRTGLGIEGASA